MALLGMCVDDELHSQKYSLTDLIALGNLPNEYAWMALRQIQALFSRGRFGKLTCFRIYRWGGWCGQEIENYLLDYGIRVSVRAFDKQCIFFSIFDTSEKQHVANWAEYLLRRKGVPMLNTVNANNLKAKELGPMPES